MHRRAAGDLDRAHTRCAAQQQWRVQLKQRSRVGMACGVMGRAHGAWRDGAW